jgi:hypothetical protein
VIGMRFIFAFLLVLVVSLSSGISLAETICDRPNGTLILVRQENQIEPATAISQTRRQAAPAGPGWRLRRRRRS